MYKPSDPRECVLHLLDRSICSVQVAACVVEGERIFGWGINHSGPNGLGEHAECHCLRRANPRRVEGATMYVIGRRRKNNRFVMSKPCPDCQERIQAAGIARVIYFDKYLWKMM